jgi:hypothetical protein
MAAVKNEFTIFTGTANLVLGVTIARKLDSGRRL